MYYPATRAIYSSLAKKYGTTIEQMADICRAPIECVVDTIVNDATKKPVYMPNIRIQGFGVFYVSEGRKSRLRFINYLNEQASQGIQPPILQLVDGKQTQDTIL